MIETTINEHEYRITKLGLFDQAHVTRKLAPVVPQLAPLITALTGDALVEAVEGDFSSMAEAIMPLANALAEMPEADFNFVMVKCLSVVKRRQDSLWSPVIAGDSVMYDDLELLEAIELIVRVVVASLGNFIQGLVTKVNQDIPAQ
jgi:hypothetical protein